MSESSYALRLDGVGKRFGAQDAVSDLSFAVERGAICGFLGPNGAGKTTTVRMILGLVEPTAGRIEVLGAPDARRVRDRIGFLPEERGLYRRMRAQDVIAYFAGMKGVPAAEGRRRALKLLEAQGLGAAARKPVKALSKGMAQKVQLLSAIAHEPDLVILDEPFSGLDPVNQQSLEQIIRDLAARGATVLFSTHVMQHAERLCDRVILMGRGRKRFDGTLHEARAAAPRLMLLEGGLTEAQIAALPGVAEVRREGPGFTARLGQHASGHDTLKTAFARDLDIRRFEVKEPTLHDAFIVLTGDAA